MDIFASRSTNCGRNFKKNVQVTQPSPEFNNSTISWSNESPDNPLRNPNQFGDYRGIDARNGKAYVAWTDSRHFFPDFQTDVQRENIGFAVVTFGPPAPENLTVTLGNGKPQISWTYNPPANLAAFNVYRVSNRAYTRIATIPASLVTSAAGSSSFTDSTASGQPSSYVVAAVDTEGEEGPDSNPVSVVVTGLTCSHSMHPSCQEVSVREKPRSIKVLGLSGGWRSCCRWPSSPKRRAATAPRQSSRKRSRIPTRG